MEGSIIATCESETNFRIQGKNLVVPFEDLKCKNLPKFTVSNLKF